jgi:hypothetical protein
MSSFHTRQGFLDNILWLVDELLHGVSLKIIGAL